MKTLLAVGCSFTNPKFQSREHPEMDCSWPKWPEVLGNKLRYNVVNLGHNGGSNDSILRSAQDYMIENKVDMVCALWTEPFRFNVHDSIPISWNAALFNAANKKLTEIQKGVLTNNVSKVFNGSELAHYLMQGDKHIKLANEQLRYIHTLDVIGTSHNVPVYHMQGCTLWRSWLYKLYYRSTVYADKGGCMGAPGRLDISFDKAAKGKFNQWLEAFLDSPYFAILDKQTNIWGWPFYQEIGGSLPLATHSFESASDRISNKDTHPSAKGHQKIASQFLEIIK